MSDFVMFGLLIFVLLYFVLFGFCTNHSTKKPFQTHKSLTHSAHSHAYMCTQNAHEKHTHTHALRHHHHHQNPCTIYDEFVTGLIYVQEIRQ